MRLRLSKSSQIPSPSPSPSPRPLRPWRIVICSKHCKKPHFVWDTRSACTSILPWVRSVWPVQPHSSVGLSIISHNMRTRFLPSPGVPYGYARTRRVFHVGGYRRKSFLPCHTVLSFHAISLYGDYPLNPLRSEKAVFLVCVRLV